MIQKLVAIFLLKAHTKLKNMKKVKVKSKQRNNFSLPNFVCSMTEYQGLGCPSTNESNFFELIMLLAKYDLLLEQHLLTSDRNATYLSPDIQNELIQSLSVQVQSNIVSEIKESRYFAVIVDSTIDISRIYQFSLSLRYVTANGDAVERFQLIIWSKSGRFF